MISSISRLQPQHLVCYPLPPTDIFDILLHSRQNGGIPMQYDQSKIRNFCIVANIVPPSIGKCLPAATNPL